MGLFNLSDGSKVGGEKEYDASEGFGKPLPDNTEVLASCTAIEWSEYEGIENIRSTWTIVLPAEHKDRKIFYTFKVNDKNPEKADKARKMLAAIDATHGGKLAALEADPTDLDLGRALISKLMVLKIGYYDMTDKGGKEGNYIKAVSPRKSGAVAEEVVREPAKKAPKKAAPPSMDQFDDDIPF